MSVTSIRREREKIEMRQLIIETAVQMYLEAGYDKLSLRGIATRIEYAVGTIYLYFKDKHELFHAMHEWAFAKFDHELDPIRSIEDPLSRLREMSRVFINFAFKNPELYDLMFILNEPMCAEKILDEWPCGQRVFGFLYQTVAEGIEKEQIKGNNPADVTFVMWSAVHGMLALHMRNRLRMYEETDRQAMIFRCEALLLTQFLNEENDSSTRKFDRSTHFGNMPAY